MIKTYLTIGVISLIAIGSLIFGFSVVGSPTDQRAKEFDKTRLQYINSLRYEIEGYFTTNQKLPDSLSDLETSRYSYSTNYKQDPETKKNFEYQKTSSTSYKLCADFGAASDPSEKQTYNYYDFDSTHPKGNHCFTFTVKPIKKTSPTSVYD